MAEWKKVVVSGSAISQLDNDLNYLSSTGAGIVSSSAQIGSDISGSLGANAALIRSLTAAGISGSLGTNAALIRSLDAATISGSLGANAALIRTLTAAGISGSLGANATLIRSLDAATISGSLGANAALIRTLTAAGISGSFTSTSASFASTIDGLTLDDVSVSNLKSALAGGFGSNAVTIGDANDIVTIGNDLVITGDLTVNGDSITANVTNLAVDDRYILLNSGSASGDSGIVFGGSKGNANQGMALILDDSDDRLKIVNTELAGDVNTDVSLAADGHLSVAGVFEGDAGDATTAGADKVGNIRVDGSSDIFIYV